jgi:S-DNA-T family DNA segregation ATPase FtsK/SpoIIIE
MRIFTFWRDLDDDDKERVIKITGILIAVFAIFTFLANVSYLFTWKADQSLLSTELSDKSIGVSNICGKLGFKWSYFLITQCFGLGSFALILILFAISMRLLLNRWHYSMLKTILLTITGAMIASFILAFISNLAGFENAFGSGLGGQCGASSVSWMTNLLGNIVTGIILVAAVILWLLFASSRFKHWAAGVGKEKEPAAEPDIPAEVPVEEPVDAPEKQDTQNSNSERDDSITLPGLDEAPASAPVQETSQKQSKEQPALEEPEGSLEIQRSDGLSTEIKKELEPYDSKSELPDYKPLSLDLLDAHESTRRDVSNEEITRNNNKIRATLENFKIQVQDVKAIVGPTVTLYKVYPAPGVKIAGIKRIQEDIGMYLHAKGVRVITLPDSVGIEVANDNPSIVPIRAVLNDEAFRTSKAELPVAIGYTIQQKVKVFDLAEAPHLLVAGATKQGKSVCLNVIVSSLLYSKHPSELKFVFIDPKMVEFSAYERLLHHYLAVLPDFHDEEEERTNAIVKNPKLAEKVLRSLCMEMDNRYELLSKAYVQKISQYNDKFNHHHLRSDEGHRFLPYIVVVIDEYADLTMSVGASGEAKTIARSISNSIIRLAQKGRAAGIHVIIATQRPSVDVITGLIKSNFPTRIAFRVVSRIDSATILDSPGAEKLIGRGDMLYYAGVETERVQCALVTNEEIAKITKAVGDQVGYKKSFNTPYYLPSVEDQSGEGDGGMVDMKNLDERFEEAAKMVVTNQRGSTSDLQRRLGMGYAKAGRVMDQLEAAGIVGPQEGSKPRQVLISSLDELEKVLEAYRNQQ